MTRTNVFSQSPVTLTRAPLKIHYMLHDILLLLLLLLLFGNDKESSLKYTLSWK